MNTEQAIQRLRAVARRQHKALSTESSYTFWLRRYMSAVRQYPETLTSEQKLERFLTELVQHRDVSASSQNQAFNAILFFYREVLGQPLQGVNALRATRPVRMRHAPSRSDTRALLSTVRNVGGHPTNLIARMLYGCGLRVSEPLNLRIKDVDLERGRLCIRGAKGGKDRMVALPASLIPEIAAQIKVAEATWARDRQNRIPLMLHGGLANKYPEYQFNRMWAWLFPAHNTCRHPCTGFLVRYRMHEANVQRAVKYARRQLGISILPHEMRHAYATDCLERGTNPRAIQAAMGHASLETTMGYLHAESLSVLSPLEVLDAARVPVGLALDRANEQPLGVPPNPPDMDITVTGQTRFRRFKDSSAMAVGDRHERWRWSGLRAVSSSGRANFTWPADPWDSSRSVTPSVIRYTSNRRCSAGTKRRNMRMPRARTSEKDVKAPWPSVGWNVCECRHSAHARKAKAANATWAANRPTRSGCAVVEGRRSRTSGPSGRGP